ncbi:MAG: purine-nucleoside phosphorylase [Planctomycetes bacterium]|nr:purine-nucleoside phosphorylase [Planctomycetota bacterium]
MRVQAADPELDALRSALAERGVGAARLAFVLGSGLGPFAERLQDATAIPYAELAGMPQSRVPGHEGRLVLGTLSGVPVVVQQGRVHLYEGWSAREVTRCVRALAELGVPGLVLTNAAGGLVPEWEIPSLMRITDHVNLQGRPPLLRGEAGLANPYRNDLGDAMDLAAADAGVELRHGTYLGLLGPTYETPAEVRMAQYVGASAVGMSTVAEAQVAASGGMRVAAVSAITNPAAGISKTPLNHAEVVAAGRELAARFTALLEAFVPRAVAALD